MEGPMCKGSVLLGSGCGWCSRCTAEQRRLDEAAEREQEAKRAASFPDNRQGRRAFARAERKRRFR